MRLSVIVPIYNVEKQITGCLESICAQTFQDFECICINDGSTDASGQVAEEFVRKDPRFRLIHQENRGLSGARNTGLAHITGEVVAFIDSDDYVHPDMFRILLDVMAREQVDVVGCRFESTDKPYPPAPKDVSGYPLRVFDQPLEAFMKSRKVPTAVWSRIYTREILSGMEFIEGICFEDVPWTVEIMSKLPRYVLVDAPLYYYHFNPASITQSAWSNEKTQSYVRIIRTVHDYLKQHRPGDLKSARKYIFNQRIKMIFNRIKKTPKHKREELWTFLREQVVHLYAQSFISYAGLRLKHKITLFKLLCCTAPNTTPSERQ